MSDGQFSSKPIRTARDLAMRGEYSEKALISSDTGRAFLQSAAVRREMNAIMEPPVPEIGRFDCAPVPARAPEEVRQLGQPLTSATLVQEYLIGLIFLRVVGWIFILFGLLIVVSGLVLFVTWLAAPRRDDTPGILAAFFSVGIGVGVGGTGAWFGIFRGRVIMEMCWFCPNGMIWLVNGSFDWYRWEDVPDVYCEPEAVRPAIGISFGRNTSWISFSNTDSSRRLVKHIEKLASAACVSSVLHMISEGKTVRFGAWRMSRVSIAADDVTVAWRDVVDMDTRHGEIHLRQHGGAGVLVPLEEVSFPTLFTALALACFAHTGERSI